MMRTACLIGKMVSAVVVFVAPLSVAAQTIIDDEDTGWSTVGSWTQYADGNAYNSDFYYDEGGSGTESATWTFTGLSSGIYDVAVTWTAHSNRATDAPFTVYDDTTSLGTVDINQELSPNDFTYNSQNWEYLGQGYEITSSTLKVTLTDNANQYVIADAVYINRTGNIPPADAVWDGGGGDNNWSTGANWVGDTAPGNNSNVHFDATSTSDSVIDTSFGGQVANFNVHPGYTGTITVARDLTVTGNVHMSGGTLSFGNYGKTISVSGNWLERGGTYMDAGTGKVLLNTLTGGTIQGAMPNVTFDDGIIGYWRMDDGTGSTIARDDSGNGYHGTLTNMDETADWHAAGADGTSFWNPGSLTFDSGTDYVNVGTIGDMADFTAAMWVKSSDASTTQILISRLLNTGGSYDGWGLRLNAGKPGVWLGGGAWEEDQSSIADGTWHHLVVSANGNTANVYVDGSLVETGVQTREDYDQPMYFGIYDNLTSNEFEGSMDDIRVYDRALSLSEIESLASGNQGTGSGVYTVTGNLAIAGDLRMLGGGLDAGSNTITLSGSWVNYGGTFTKGTSTVVLDGINQVMSGSTVFHNLTKTVTAATSLYLDYKGRQSVSGALILQGADSNLLTLTSTNSAFSGSLVADADATSPTLQYLSVSNIDSDAGQEMSCSTGCVNDGNNSNWNFTTSLPVSGTVYTDEGSTAIGANKTVAVHVNGVATTTDETDVSGQYSASVTGVGVGDVLTIFLNDETEQALTVYIASGSNMVGADLYQNRLILHNGTGGVVTTTHLNTADTAGDTDVTAFYSIAGTDLTTAYGKELYIWPSTTFVPDGQITSHDIDVNGTLTLGTNTGTITGSWDSTGGSFTSSHLVQFTSSGSETITASTGTFWDIIFGADASAPSTSLDTDSDLVLHWKLDETSSPAIDSSGNGNTGTWNGDPTYTSSVPTELTGYSTNAWTTVGGSIDWVEASTDYSLDVGNTLTIAAWVKRDNALLSDYAVILSRRDTGWNGNQYSLYYNSAEKLDFWTLAGGAFQECGPATTAVQDTNWHHVAFTWDGSNCDFYLDGIDDGGETSFTYTPAIIGTQNLWIATELDGSRPLFGDFDDVRLYNRPLTSDEVANLASGNIGTTSTSGSGSFVLGASLDVDGSVTISPVGNILNASSYTITLSGSWINNSGINGFDKGTSTVAFDGYTQTLSGSTIFNNFTKIIQGYNVVDASFVDATAVGQSETLAYGIAFNADGTKMYIVGSSNNSVYEYTLSTAFDASTASHNYTLAIGSQETEPFGIVFKPDGTKMFIVGTGGQEVNEYTLSSGFDLSSASHVDAFSVSAQDSQPSGIEFNNDGTRMFIVGYNNDNVYEYELATPYDISTASYTQTSFSIAQDTIPAAIRFNSNGTRMFIVGYTSDNVNEYVLTYPYDISTATYSQALSVTGQETQPAGIAFNSNGTKLFVVGSTGNDVNEYTITPNASTLVLRAQDRFSVSGALILNGATSTLLNLTGSTIQVIQESTQPVQDQIASSYTSCTAGNYNMGYRFDVNANGKITQLGVMIGDGGPRTVRLYSYPAGTVLATVAVNGNGPGSWAYKSITPVDVTSGSSYVVAQQNNTGNYCYYTVSTPFTQGSIDVIESRYSFNTDLMPTSTSTSTMYGMADVTFEIIQPTAASGSLVLDAESGTQDLQYLDVSSIDSDAGQTMDCLTGCTNSGNNSNWNFEAAPAAGGGGNYFQFFDF